jgi:hypothetical protein
MQVNGAVHKVIVWSRATVQDVFVLDFYAFESILVVPHRTIVCEFIGCAEFLGQTLDECHRLLVFPGSQ